MRTSFEFKLMMAVITTWNTKNLILFDEIIQQELKLRLKVK